VGVDEGFAIDVDGSAATTLWKNFFTDGDVQGHAIALLLQEELEVLRQLMLLRDDDGALLRLNTKQNPVSENLDIFHSDLTGLELGNRIALVEDADRLVIELVDGVVYLRPAQLVHDDVKGMYPHGLALACAIFTVANSDDSAQFVADEFTLGENKLALHLLFHHYYSDIFAQKFQCAAHAIEEPNQVVDILPESDLSQSSLWIGGDCRSNSMVWTDLGATSDNR